jgi:hypothetical protein
MKEMKEEIKEEDSKMANEEEQTASDYEDPRFYFLKVLLKGLPVKTKESDKYEEYFGLLVSLIKSSTVLFTSSDPYLTQNIDENMDDSDKFS